MTYVVTRTLTDFDVVAPPQSGDVEWTEQIAIGIVLQILAGSLKRISPSAIESRLEYKKTADL